MKLKTRTQQILTVMHILAWVAFIGLMVEAGAILVSSAISYINPEGSKDLYQGLNLYNLRQFNIWHYTVAISFKVALSCMKAFVAYQVIQIFTKISLINPFTMEVAQALEKISYNIFGIWFVSMVHNVHTGWLLQSTGELQGNWIPGDFIFIAGVLFIVSQIFKRGVEIQSENDLTV